MSKFKIKLKITGFEMEIEGSRDDVPLINQAIGQQISGLIQPMNDIVEGEAKIIEEKNVKAAEVQDHEELKSKKRKRTSSRKKETSKTNSTEEINNVVDFRHDPQKHSSPSQIWKTTEKCIWLMYVLGKETNQTEFTAKQITETFNRYFKEAKLIEYSNVNRDLGRAKAKGLKATVGQDVSKNPSTWFLTQDGKAVAEKLISGN